MGRNYFSKHGGPYFINNGFSSHSHDHNDSEDTGSERALILSVCVGVPLMFIALYAIVIAL